MSLHRTPVLNKELGQEQLLCESKHVFEEELMITAEESNFSFSVNSQSLLWFEHRRGRLTASKFGAICRTSEVLLKSLVREVLQLHIIPKTEGLLNHNTQPIRRCA